MIVPCKDCMLIPICRNKNFDVLVTDCSTLHAYTKVSMNDCTEDQRVRIENVERTLSPNTWGMMKSGMLKEKGAFAKDDTM